jgi:hypothetical protein
MRSSSWMLPATNCATDRNRAAPDPGGPVSALTEKGRTAPACLCRKGSFVLGYSLTFPCAVHHTRVSIIDKNVYPSILENAFPLVPGEDTAPCVKGFRNWGFMVREGSRRGYRGPLRPWITLRDHRSHGDEEWTNLVPSSRPVRPSRGTHTKGKLWRCRQWALTSCGTGPSQKLGNS